MTGVKNIFDVVGRSMGAQMVRLNTIASNIANFTTIMMNVFSVGMMMTRARAYGSGSSTWARTTIS